MIKLNWTRGQNLGLSLIYLGLMGFLQIIFIAIAQYSLGAGSRFAVLFMPLGAIIATFYSIIILFESQTTMKQYRGKRQYGKKKGDNDIQKKVKNFIALPKVKPVIYVVVGFTLFFLIGLGITSPLLDDGNAIFIISENVGSIGTLVMATYIETSNKQKTRR